MKNIYLFFIFLINALHAGTIQIPSDNFEEELNKALETTLGNVTIIMPEGKFYLQNELIITNPGITLKGAGKLNTILSFKKQIVGAQGIYASGDQITFEDFAVEDSWGNAIKVIGSNHVTFRGLKISWTRGPSKKNGAYGLYPVLTNNVLVEDCEVSDSSDAGIYVGQSRNIIVRNNIVYRNVAGIEIENSDDADVYDNEVFNNTAGILIFTLPDLVKKDSNRARVFNNNVYSNNHKNFAVKGSIVKLVPKGLGIFVLASNDTEIFNNQIRDYDLAGIAITNFMITERDIQDQEFDPMPRGIYIYGNTLERGGPNFFTGTQMDFIIKFLTGFKPQDILYDGIFDGSYNGPRPTETDRVCVRENIVEDGPIRFANLHLDNKQKFLPFPGGPITKKVSDYNCHHELVNSVTLDPPNELPSPELPPTEGETLAACKKQVIGVNWEAFDYDCPDLSDYNLFEDPSNPTENPINGKKYLLTNTLFTDYAKKDRFIFVPPNRSINYKPKYSLDFPIGTLITKTFSYQNKDRDKDRETFMETRILIKRTNGWIPLNYEWDNFGNATLNRIGFIKTMSIRPNGHKKNLKINYAAPNLRQCYSCHKINDRLTPIGPRAKFLNRSGQHSIENQLESWARDGLLNGMPTDPKKVPWTPSWDDLNQDLDIRGKAYLEINCAHCHNAVGAARNTGLFLNTEIPSDSIEIGYCKSPVAAGLGTGGRKFALFPGKPKKSILWYRMVKNHPAVKMPQLGRSVPHKEGNDMIAEWIKNLPLRKCKSL